MTSVTEGPVTNEFLLTEIRLNRAAITGKVGRYELFGWLGVVSVFGGLVIAAG